MHIGEIWGRADGWVRRNRGKLRFSIALNALFLVILLLLYHPGFETNDDMGIACMVNGAKGVYDVHLIHISCVVGYILKGLYLVCQGIPWYSLLQYFLLFWAFTAVTYVFLNKLENKSALWLVSIVVFWFSYEGYIRLQFTKTAGIVSSAGVLLLLYAVCGEKLRWKAAAGGFLLSGAGFMYREDQFLAQAALLTGAGLFLVLGLRHVEKGRRLRRFLQYVAPFGLLLVFLAGLHLFDDQMYRSPFWKDYFRYDDVRTELYDYGFPRYAEHLDGYEELGLSATAVKLLYSWTHYDPEQFPSETLEKIAAMKEPRRFTRQTVRDFFDLFPISFFTITCFYCFLLIFAFWLCWGGQSVEAVLALLYETALVFLLYLYLFYEGRYLINRVDVGIWFGVCLMVLWTFPAGKAQIQGRVGLAFLLCIVAMRQMGWRERWWVNSEQAVNSLEKERAVMLEAYQDPEHLYFTRTTAFSLAASYDIFDRVPFGVMQNSCPLGGWAVGTQAFNQVLEKYGITNPMRDMIGNEKVYVVDKNIDLLVQYLQEYYDEDASAELVKEMGGYPVYRILG